MIEKKKILFDMLREIIVLIPTGQASNGKN